VKFKKVPFWLAMLVTAFAFYLIDCLVVLTIDPHSNLPWYENGLYAKGPFGIVFSVAFGIAAIWLFVVHRRE
jgi:hypothetical protein